MAFHVQIRRGFRNAHAFNLSEDQLRGQILEPWTRGDVVEFGDSRWLPAESRLTVLEGAELEGPDLGYGQGWNNALKAAEDVTERLLATAPSAHTDVAVLAGSERAAMEAFVVALGLRPVAWEVVRAELLALAGVVAPPDGSKLAANAVVIVASGETPTFDVGLALGALGGRAILTQVGEQPPQADLTPIRLDAPGLAPLHALAQRLRSAGCPVQPSEGWDAPGRFSH